MGSKESDTKRIDTLTTPQKKLLGDLSRLLRGELGTSAEVYQGDIAPEASALQQQFFEFAAQYPGMAEQMSQPAYTVDPAAREAVYEAERAVAMRDFQDFTRQAAEQYNARGAGRSGGLQRSFAEGAAQLSDQLNARYANLGYQDEMARRAAAESAAARGLQAQQFGASIMSAGGDLQRMIQSQQNQEAYNKWQAGQWYGNPALQYLPMALGTQAFQTGVQSNDSGLFPGGLPIGPWSPAIS